MKNLEGKVAIVTGAARGIGAAIAKKLAERGANVAICDLKAEWCDETVQALAERDPEDETTKMLCSQVYDLARMAAQPLEAEEITAFLERSRKILNMVVKG